MEGFGGFGLSTNFKRKRSSGSRRPRNDAELFPNNLDFVSLSSTPPSDNVNKVSSDENTDCGMSSWNKELNLNCCSSRASTPNFSEDQIAWKLVKNKDGCYGESKEACISGSLGGGGRYSESVAAPSNWKSINELTDDYETHSNQRSGRISSTSNSAQLVVPPDGQGHENKLKKVKLKVGGVTRTIHAQTTLDGSFVGGSSSTRSQPRHKLILQDNSDDNMESSLRGVPLKDFPQSTRQADKHEAIRRSKRVPKRRILDGTFDEDDADEEIRYLEKLRASKVSVNHGTECENDQEEGSKKQQKMSRVMQRNVDSGYNLEFEDYGSMRSGKEGRRLRNMKAFDTDFVEEEESLSDKDLDTKKKKPRKEFVDSLGDSKKEFTVTTRQRSLQNGKDVLSGSTATLIEFPNGLPPAPPRKQKEKLSDIDQQLKKAEAAQRRKMQMEKAARESEAEAIRKILGQDSSRKKREDKMKKREKELVQERTVYATKLPSNTVRWIMRPSGTVVTFPIELGLPSIFCSKPCSYPAPREKCAGPSCTNPYKYRDSKSKLPLCSLQCYKAIHEEMRPLSAC